MPKSTPAEPPKAALIKKVFSLILHLLWEDLYLSIPININETVFNKISPTNKKL